MMGDIPGSSGGKHDERASCSSGSNLSLCLSSDEEGSSQDEQQAHWSRVEPVGQRETEGRNGVSDQHLCRDAAGQEEGWFSEVRLDSIKDVPVLEEGWFSALHRQALDDPGVAVLEEEWFAEVSRETKGIGGTLVQEDDRFLEATGEPQDDWDAVIQGEGRPTGHQMLTRGNSLLPQAPETGSVGSNSSWFLGFENGPKFSQPEREARLVPAGEESVEMDGDSWFLGFDNGGNACSETLATIRRNHHEGECMEAGNAGALLSADISHPAMIEDLYRWPSQLGVTSLEVENWDVCPEEAFITPNPSPMRLRRKFGEIVGQLQSFGGSMERMFQQGKLSHQSR